MQNGSCSVERGRSEQMKVVRKGLIWVVPLPLSAMVPSGPGLLPRPMSGSNDPATATVCIDVRGSCYQHMLWGCLAHRDQMSCSSTQQNSDIQPKLQPWALPGSVLIHGSCNHWRPWECLGSRPPLGAMCIVQGPSYNWHNAPTQPVSVLMMAHVVTKDHKVAQVLGNRMWPCWDPRYTAARAMWIWVTCSATQGRGVVRAWATAIGDICLGQWTYHSQGTHGYTWLLSPLKAIQMSETWVDTRCLVGAQGSSSYRGHTDQGGLCCCLGPWWYLRKNGAMSGAHGHTVAKVFVDVMTPVTIEGHATAQHLDCHLKSY